MSQLAVQCPPAFSVLKYTLSVVIPVKGEYMGLNCTSEEIRCFAVAKWEIGGREIKIFSFYIPAPVSV